MNTINVFVIIPLNVHLVFIVAWFVRGSSCLHIDLFDFVLVENFN